MTKAPRSERRTDALSRGQIVENAIAILDEHGDEGLTFRALSARLATGPGAIYYYVADKNALLTIATETVIARAMSAGGGILESQPGEAIRAIALRMFDLIDMRPWVGAHLAREPMQPAMLRILEAVGQRLETMAVPESALFDTVTALVGYIVGSAAQNAANARLAPPGTNRDAALTAVAKQWASLDATHYPFVRKMARVLAKHDDRKQFLAGVDLILGGLAMVGLAKLA